MRTVALVLGPPPSLVLWIACIHGPDRCPRPLSRCEFFEPRETLPAAVRAVLDAGCPACGALIYPLARASA